MHTLFEGVLNHKTRLLLSSFVNDYNYFTLDFLNERIASFSYGRAEKQNKPPRPFTSNDISYRCQVCMNTSIQLIFNTVL